MIDIPTRYNPKETEDKWYQFWLDHDYFRAKLNPQKKPFCIVIPPPNVTGILHMGHALNNTIQDILIRYQRMKGKEALWMPGTDHAGIATQNVVEKSIAKEGLKRQDLGREKFIERVWQWKEQYGSTIIRQLKKLGASCDWQRERFTMDEAYSRSVTEVFIRLYEKGLIYQGNYIINWCPRCSTALSDEEAPHKEMQANLYYLKYPLEDGKHISVATTRPETMLGDTAVAVNPKDKRYKKLLGKTVILPLLNRKIKIIADEMVEMNFGTGAVKVTPAHDPNDYALGKKHGLEFINVMHPDARMNENAGKYSGMDRFQAREVILEDLRQQGLLEKTESHSLSAGHCYRCNTIIEPYLSNQWFVKMKPLAAPAIEVVKKAKIKFYPRRWTKVYLNWMENIQDWCISRQIWWGHRIPVYYCTDCKKTGKNGVIVSRIKPEKCPVCSCSNIYQEEDVLDTWFSSWLWPFATFYWGAPAEGETPHTGRTPALPIRRAANEDLQYFYPTSVLVTAPEIIFFWVARMIMAGKEFMGKIPFSDVYIHGTVRDIEGKKMSKSLGNIIDPLEIINEYGTDALRFSLISITAQGQDVFLSKERFEQGRNFANKIWNASRFILMNLDEKYSQVDLCTFFEKEKLSITNRWILSRFYSTLKIVEKNLENYKFNEAANSLYSFFWHEFCDWYLELAKPALADKQNSECRNTQLIMYKVLEKFLRCLHPFMPFITEEIWQLLNQDTGPTDSTVVSIMIQPWPHIQEKLIDKKTEKQAQIIFDLIAEIRNLRSLIEIKPDSLASISVYAHTKIKEKILSGNIALIKKLARLQELKLLNSSGKPDNTISAVAQDIDIFLAFGGLIDTEKEKQRFKKELTDSEKRKNAKDQLLKNPEFIKKAPEELVKKTRQEKAELSEKVKRLEKLLKELS